MQASTASALKDLVMTDLENKTRSATSDTPWGASTTDLQTIAQGTYSREDYALIMSIVWQRLGSSRWRCVYKALEVLKHLIMHGSARCLDEAKGALGHLETLRTYRKVEGGRDVGEGVRHRAERIVEMLRDENILQQERERSEELRRKMVGGQGPYNAGRYDSMHYDGGRYDDSYGSDGVNRVGTSGFKGYGEDDSGGVSAYKGYDDGVGGLKGYGEPEKKPETGVDDLLGGEPVNLASGDHQARIDEDDDDDFDPRGDSTATQQNGSAHVGGVFSALALTENESESAVAAVAVSGASASTESTSAMVARLAAQKGAGAVVPVSAPGRTEGVTGETSASLTGASVWDNSPSGEGPDSNAEALRVAPGMGIWADVPSRSAAPAAHSSAVASQPVRNTPIAPQQPKITKKDDDPFSDLLATARKTVL